jgi:Fe-S cluster biosynthesis and repair protein YggX
MSCGHSGPPSIPEAPKPGAHMVKCVKFGKEMEGLDRIPWKGDLGKRVYDNVSKEAWQMLIEHFFFGEGAKLPEGYVAPKAKG